MQSFLLAVLFVLGVIVNLTWAEGLNLIKCPENEFRGCKPCCTEPTCKQPQSNCLLAFLCTRDCNIICRCDGELIRDTATNKCVKQSECFK
ncbi:unnamed protein product [Psylliodes chrysocephalus]|uniref:Uncharacterized protein n=1 Tax=Psylliodes chrysocephalus TaxID=3402493 RepID=A0A9P0CU89_9CUCU|nr:unnamed protein product [Psylliodes chrysocephala]